METKKSELLRRIKDLKGKMEEFSENIDLLESELKELEEKEVEVSATGVCLKSVVDKLYFYIDSENKVFGSRFSNHSFDNLRLEKNNCFATREQAEQEALRIEGQEFIRRCAMLWNKEHDWRKEESKTEWYIEYSISNKKLTTHSWCNLTSGMIFFDTQGFAEKCIEELKKKYNEEQIKTIFGVK